MLTRTKRLAAVGAAVLTAGTGGFLSLGTATAAPRDVSFVMHFVAVRTSMSTPAAGAYYETERRGHRRRNGWSGGRLLRFRDDRRLLQCRLRERERNN